jgi:hypothetical protein
MSRTKVLLLSLLAVCAVGSVASATALAELQGPWWLKVEGGKQVKIEQEKELQVKSTRVGALPLRIVSPEAGNTVEECTVVENKGWLWNGPHQGQDKESIVFVGGCIDKWKGCAISRVASVSEAKVVSELMWKYRGEKKELGEVGKQEIYNVLAPNEKIEEYEKGKFRSKLTTISVPAGGECPAETLDLYSVGTKTTWENQPILKKGEHEKIEVVWGTAARVEPENLDRRVVTLNWLLPNVTWLHHKEVEVTAALQLTDPGGAAPAEVEGMLGLQEEFGNTEFGAWKET